MIKEIFLKTSFSIYILIFLCSCAAKVTRGELNSVDVYSKIGSSQKSVEFRYLSEERYIRARKQNSTSYTLEKDDKVEQVISSIFKKAEVFKSVKVSAFTSDSIQAEDTDKLLEERILKKPIGLSESDYFVDFRWKIRVNPNGDASLIMMPFVVISLGFIPLYHSNDLFVEATVYNRLTKKITTYEMQNKVSSWHWTPLILAPGAIFMPDRQSLFRPSIEIILENLIEKMLKEGAFT